MSLKYLSYISYFRFKHKDGLLQKAKATVQKIQKDNQKLQTEIISQNQNYDTLKIKLESLKDKNLELDKRLRYTLFYKWFIIFMIPIVHT